MHFTIPSGCYALVSRHGADEEYEFPGGFSCIDDVVVDCLPWCVQYCCLY